MFSPRIYWRLFEAINQAWWPLPLLAPLLALAVGLWAWRTGSASAWRAALACSAGACALVAWAYHWQRFAPIQWVAEGYAWGFGLQALGLLLLASRASAGVVAVVRRQAGAALGLWALAAHPLLPALSGRPWAQAEVWGLAPDPTAIAMLALWLCLPRRPATTWLPAVLPLLWCAISAATLATMGEWQAVVPLAAVVVALAAAR